jgi:hypothetical protein
MELLNNSGVTYVNVPGSQGVQEVCADKALQMKQVTAAAAATAAGQDDSMHIRQHVLRQAAQCLSRHHWRYEYKSTVQHVRMLHDGACDGGTTAVAERGCNIAAMKMLQPQFVQCIDICSVCVFAC